MEIEHSEQQEQELKKLRKLLYRKVILAFLGYGAWMVFGDLFFIIINVFFFNNADFLFFTTLGTSIIVFCGLTGTIEEIREDIDKELKMILKSSNR